MEYTFRQLQQDLSKLTEEQLDMVVRWSGDGRAGKLGGLDVLSEDHYQCDDYAVPKSELSEDDKDPVLIYPVGTPILWES